MTYRELEDSPLGKNCWYPSTYDPSLLYPISRGENRKQIAIGEPLPFFGVDIWNAYEVSWLNKKGKPQIAMCEFFIPCSSSHILESKSVKLFFQSLNQSRYESAAAVKRILEKDLSEGVRADVSVLLIPKERFELTARHELEGNCIDDLDVTIDANNHIDPSLLNTLPQEIEETLVTHLFKSNCPVTGQPDWATLQIHYQGKRIDHEGLLKYLISFRENCEFHEQCIERIFMDISLRCQPNKLTVYGRYTRRGGIDINPFRSNFETMENNRRSYRQ